MARLPTRNQANEFGRSRFEQLLAQYRARIYEANYLLFANQVAPIEEVIQSRLDKPTILVIEDNTDEWFLIRYGLLHQFPQVECTWLADAAQVVPYLDQYEKTEKELPRLILLDLYLPSAQAGLQVLQALKAHPLYQPIPAVVFSHSVDPIDIAQVYSCSANSYVVKPTEPSEWRTAFAQLEPYWHKAKGDNSSLPKR